MPYIYVKLAFGEKAPILAKKVNPIKPDLAWVRGMDVEPILIPVKEIDKFERDLDKRMAKIKKEALETKQKQPICEVK